MNKILIDLSYTYKGKPYAKLAIIDYGSGVIELATPDGEEQIALAYDGTHMAQLMLSLSKNMIF